MKSILISDRDGMLECAYSNEIIDILQREAGLDNTFYKSCDIRNGKIECSETEFVFSTRGMPTFTEEIRRYFPNLKAVIGKLVVEMLKKYKLKIFVFAPFLFDEKANELGVEKMFFECNVISNHLADNEATKGMLCEKHVSSMLPYATFLN